MDTAVIGVVIGALVGVIAPILNSYFTNRFSASKEDRDYRRKLQRDRISATKQLFEDTLFYLETYNPGTGDAEREEMQRRYRYRLELTATPDIIEQFRTTSDARMGPGDYAAQYGKLTDQMKKHIASLTEEKTR